MGYWPKLPQIVPKWPEQERPEKDQKMVWYWKGRIFSAFLVHIWQITDIFGPDHPGPGGSGSVLHSKGTKEHTFIKAPLFMLSMLITASRASRMVFFLSLVSGAVWLLEHLLAAWLTNMVEG